MNFDKASALRLLSGLNVMSFTAFQLALITLYPYIAERSGLDVATVIACFSAGSLCFLWGSPFWAARGDHLGRQKVIRLGLSGLFFSLSLVVALVFTGGLLTATAAMALLLASRLVYGFTASAVVPSSQALQTDLAENGDIMKAMFNHSISLNLGRVAGPLMVVLAGGRADLVLWICLGWAGLLVIANRVAPTLKTKVRDGQAGPPPLSMVLKTIFGVFLVALAFTTFIEALNSSLAVTLKHAFVLTGAQASAFMARLLLVGSVLMLLTQFAARHWLRLDWRRALMAGAGALVVGAVLFQWMESPIGLWLAVAALSVSLGLIPPGYMAALSHLGARDAHHGGRAGWIGTAHTLGYAAGGALTAFALRAGLPTPVLIFVLMIAAVAAVVHLLRHPSNEEARS